MYKPCVYIVIFDLYLCRFLVFVICFFTYGSMLKRAHFTVTDGNRRHNVCSFVVFWSGLKTKNTWVFPKRGGSPKWLVYFMENPKIKWMITRGTTILGNLHIDTIPNLTLWWYCEPSSRWDPLSTKFPISFGIYILLGETFKTWGPLYNCCWIYIYIYYTQRIFIIKYI